MKQIILIGMLMLLVVGCKGTVNIIEEYNNQTELMNISDLNIFAPDYSKVGYLQIYPNESHKFIYLECVNSTLVINESMVYCTK